MEDAPHSAPEYGGGTAPEGEPPVVDYWNSDSDRDSDDGDEDIPVTADEMYDDAEDERLEKEVGALAGSKRVGELRLSCPCCFSEICADAQRHATYKSQWRAMFATNVTVDASKPLVPAASLGGSGGGGGGKVGGGSGSGRGRGGGGGGGADGAGGEADPDRVLPVACGGCGANVGVQDAEELFHFFGVIPSV